MKLDELYQVLWLEDDLKDFQTVKSFLEGDGFSISLVSDVESFEREVETHEFDLVILDIRGGAKFNGIDIINSEKFDFKDAKVCILSGFLFEDDIRNYLLNLEQEIFVIGKELSFEDEKDVEVGLESQIRRIISGQGVHTNRTYFEEVDRDKFDLRSGVTTFEEYNRLNPSEREFVKNSLLEMASGNIAQLSKEGFKWFLISGPKGKIIRKEKSDPGITSSEISHRSVERGFPCVATTSIIRNEEIRIPQVCNGLYEYYFGINISFFANGESDRYCIHFDSGSELSWFNLKFLREVGIGRTGDYNNNVNLSTADGKTKKVWYYSEEKEIAVYCQENLENVSLTKLNVRGIPDWHKISFSGVLKSNDDISSLCEVCVIKGFCLKREIGLIGSDILKQPKPLRLVLDGSTLKTSIEQCEDE